MVISFCCIVTKENIKITYLLEETLFDIKDIDSAIEHIKDTIKRDKDHLHKLYGDDLKYRVEFETSETFVFTCNETDLEPW